MRVAWYAAPDGEGPQIAVADSNIVTTADIVTGVQVGAVQAPSSALSARVRLMVRPLGREFAALMADNVQFERTAAPAPTPIATPRVLPTPSSAPRVSEPGLALTPVVNTSAPPSVAPEGARLAAPPVEREASRGAGAAPTQVVPRPAAVPRARDASMLRITEVLSDPVEAGNDADFEWIEIANLGREVVSLAGLLLADNQGTIELPSLVLAPGSVLLVAGAQARVRRGGRREASRTGWAMPATGSRCSWRADRSSMRCRTAAIPRTTVHRYPLLAPGSHSYGGSPTTDRSCVQRSP